MDKRSIAQQVLDILEDARNPLTISQIRDALTVEVSSSYILATIDYHVKKGIIKKEKREKLVSENIFHL